MQRRGRRKSFKGRLGIRGCCGSQWGIGSQMLLPVREGSSDGEGEEEEETTEILSGRDQNAVAEERCEQTRGTGMNLAMQTLEFETRSPAMQRGGGWKSLKGRLGMRGCCGRLRGIGSQMRMPVREGSSDGEREEEEETTEILSGSDQNAVAEERCEQTRGTGMNLAMALAAERHFRAAAAQQQQQQEGEACSTPLRVSLMRLLEVGEDAGAAEEKEQREDREKSNRMCCVCMGRRKGSAFIPCGHTFCRVCSRALRLNRGSCPLCNRSILDILDIF